MAVALIMVVGPSVAFAATTDETMGNASAEVQRAPVHETATTAPKAAASQAQSYAAREASAKGLQNFQGGDTTVVLGGGALVIILVVILIIVLI